MATVTLSGQSGKGTSGAAQQRARGADRRAAAEARRKERTERRARRLAWREVKAAKFVYFWASDVVGCIRITKQEARLLIKKLGSRLMHRQTADCISLEVCPF